jgi:hypothetical protein
MTSRRRKRPPARSAWPVIVAVTLPDISDADFLVRALVAPVPAFGQASAPIRALIGRDILNEIVMLWDGPADVIAFPAPCIPQLGKGV